MEHAPPLDWIRKSKVKQDAVEERRVYLAKLAAADKDVELYAESLLYEDDFDCRKAAIALCPNVFKLVFSYYLDLNMTARYFGYNQTRSLYNFLEWYGVLAEFRQVVLSMKDDIRWEINQRKWAIYWNAHESRCEEARTILGDDPWLEKTLAGMEDAHRFSTPELDDALARHSTAALRTARSRLYVLAREWLEIRLGWIPPSQKHAKSYSRPWLKRNYTPVELLTMEEVA